MRRLRRLQESLAAACATFLIACFLVALAAHASVTAPNKTDTDPLNLQPATQQAFLHFYDLDYAAAEAGFQKIAAEHPDDPIAADYLLNNAVFQELYRLDLLDTTLYVQDGFLSGKHGVTEDPKTSVHIEALYNDALRLANARLAKNPGDTDALFARGFGTSLETVYIGMVEKKYTAALKMALAARRDNDQVLKNDPKYVDAYLIVGVHEYVLGSLSLPFKVLAGIVGIHGSKAKGMAELHRVGQYGTINSVSARTALSIFLRREAKYPQAISVIDGLEQQYPRNFLFALENANLLKDSGQGMKAIAAYQSLIANMKNYPNPHTELAYYGLGEAARGQRHYQIALAAYLAAATHATTSPLMQRRAHLRAGQVDDLLGHRQQAIQQYDAVIALGSQFSQAQEAARLRNSPYKGT